MTLRMITVLAAVVIAEPVGAQTPAFPGAEGAGMFSEGGRGGVVIEVTNLDDDGPGSLREAVKTASPRTVVFRVSGTIELQSNLEIRHPRITIAGQTAPGDGICLKNYGINVYTDDVIVRYIRIRPGDSNPSELDDFLLDAVNVQRGNRIIFDHCSTSWALDEVLSVTMPDYETTKVFDSVTIQWCLIAEGLNPFDHSSGSLVRGVKGARVTFHHNLFAHNRRRNPCVGNYILPTEDPEGLLFDFRNNVIYNWGVETGHTDGADGVVRKNFISNYYITGPNSSVIRIFSERAHESRGYFSDNWFNGVNPADPWSLVDLNIEEDLRRDYMLDEPVSVAPLATDDARTASLRVLEGAGASFPRRDVVDRRIVNDVLAGSSMEDPGGIIGSQDEVGGWPRLESEAPEPDEDHDGMPDEWERVRGLDARDPDDGILDPDGDGYTNVEEYLNCLVGTCDWTLGDGGEEPDCGAPSGDGSVDCDCGAPTMDGGAQPVCENSNVGCQCNAGSRRGRSWIGIWIQLLVGDLGLVALVD